MDRPALVLGSTWLIAICCLARLLWAPVPGTARMDLALVGCVVLWCVGILLAGVGRRRRAAALDAAIEAALTVADRRRTADATMVRR